MIKKRTTFFDKDAQLNKGYAQKKSVYEENTTLKKLLPEVEILSEYEEVHPGTTAQLLQMIEEMKIDHHNIELTKEQNKQRLRTAGMVFSLLLLLAMLGGGLWALQMGMKIAGNSLIMIFSAVTLLSSMNHIKSFVKFFTIFSPGDDKKPKQKRGNYKNGKPKKSKPTTAKQHKGAQSKKNSRAGRIMIQKSK